MAKRFSFKQKLAHYLAVAKGEKEVKADSKFSKEEQLGYAKGQADARNEQRRIWAYKNATDEQRTAYLEKKAKAKEEYLKSQKKKKK